MIRWCALKCSAWTAMDRWKEEMARFMLDIILVKLMEVLVKYTFVTCTITIFSKITFLDNIFLKEDPQGQQEIFWLALINSKAEMLHNYLHLVWIIYNDYTNIYAQQFSWLNGCLMQKKILNWVLFPFYFLQRLKAFLKPRSNFSTPDQTHRHRQAGRKSPRLKISYHCHRYEIFLKRYNLTHAFVVLRWAGRKVILASPFLTPIFR